MFQAQHTFCDSQNMFNRDFLTQNGINTFCDPKIDSLNLLVYKVKDYNFNTNRHRVNKPQEILNNRRNGQRQMRLYPPKEFGRARRLNRSWK